MHSGESNLNGKKVCEDCAQSLETRVCMSAAGYYLGSWCNCGPYSRESGYFGSKQEAEVCLREWEEMLRVAHIHEERPSLPNERKTGFNPDGLTVEFL